MADPLLDMYGIAPPEDVAKFQNAPAPIDSMGNEISPDQAAMRATQSPEARRDRAKKNLPAQREAAARAAALKAAAIKSGKTVDEAAKAVALAEQARQSQAALAGPRDVRSEDMAGMQAEAGTSLFNQSLGRAQETVRSTGPRPFHKPVKQYTDTMGELIPESRQAAAEVQSAELSAAQLESAQLQAEADAQQKLHLTMHANEVARIKRGEEVHIRTQKAAEVARKAADEALKASDIDPDRGWGEKGVGAKIAAVLAAGFLGFAGLDPMAHINAVIQNSLDAQKYNRDQKRAGVDVANAAHQTSLADYDAIRAQLDDEETADLVYEARSLMMIRAQAAAKLADAKVEVLNKQQQAVMNGLDEALAEKLLRIGKVSEANTPLVTSVTPKYKGAAGQLNVAAGKAGLDMVKSGLGGVVEQAGKRQSEERGAAADIEKARIESMKKKPEEVRNEFNQRESVTTGTKDAQRLKDAISSLRNKYQERGLPGITWGIGAHEVPGPDTDEVLQTELKNIEYLMTSVLTGANSPPEMQKQLASAISNPGSEGELWGTMDELERFADDDIERVKRALDDPQRADYENVAPDQMTPYGPQTARDQSRPSVVTKD